MTRPTYRAGEIRKYFPDDGDELDISSVVVHVPNPDTTIGFVTRKFKDEDSEYFRQKLYKAIQLPPDYIDGKSGEESDIWRYEVEWSHAPPSFEGFGKFAFPVVRRAFPAGNFANQLVSVQPMSVPSGAIFYHDYKYPSGSLDSIAKSIADMENDRILDEVEKIAQQGDTIKISYTIGEGVVAPKKSWFAELGDSVRKLFK